MEQYNCFRAYTLKVTTEGYTVCVLILLIQQHIYSIGILWCLIRCLQHICFLVYNVHGNQTQKTTYTATATMWFFLSIPFFRSISDPCSWLVTIDWWSIYFCSQRTSCGTWNSLMGLLFAFVLAGIAKSHGEYQLCFYVGDVVLFYFCCFFVFFLPMT